MLSDSAFHLLPINGQMEETLSTNAPIQEIRYIQDKAVDAADRHTDVHGLLGYFGKTASEGCPAQRSGSLGLQEVIIDTFNPSDAA